MSERRSVLVTFKPKDQRPDRQTDKIEIVRRALTKGTRAHFLNAATAAKGTGRAPIENQVVGYDIDRYEAPIVSAQLTHSEIQALRENGNVATVEYDAPCHAAGFGPYPHLRQMQENACPIAETVPHNVKQVHAEQAWGTSMGKGIKVAVLDTGIDFNHPDLKPNYVDGVSFVPGTTPMDDQGHGTHCAGVIAAARNGRGLVGVAPEASLYAVKVLDKDANGQFGWSIAGIDWCMRNGINIISMSLGDQSAPTALELICNAAWSKGILIVAGAGNQDENPVPPQQSNVDYPARYNNVIAVSSIDASNVIAPNSARGPEVEFCAPGVSVQSTLLGGECGTLSGTSVACPHVAGVAALTWGAHLPSNITNEQVWNVLASTADDLGRKGRDSSYGYGRVNAEVAVSSASFPPKKGYCL